jgi:hypothetical protein
MDRPSVFDESSPIIDLGFATRVAEAFGSVIRDWEQLLILPYGLALIKLGSTPGWQKVQNASLGRKTDALRRVSQLADLCPDHWVTMRNRTQHGLPRFDPTSNELVFRGSGHARDLDLRLSDNDVLLESVDVYLANCAIARIIAFNVEAQYALIKTALEDAQKDEDEKVDA